MLEACSSNWTHWIILTSPFLLSLIFYSFGLMVSKREIELSDKIEQERKYFTAINKQIHNLVSGVFTSSDDADESETSKNLEILRLRLNEQQESNEKRKWTTEGLAQFGEVLRAHSSINDLSYYFLQALVKYLKVNQGGVFLVSKNEEDETILELRACYAYERKKFLKKVITAGEGLVGQCYLEKQHILLNSVPPEYVLISSGLGQATPNCIVLLPLLADETVEGVVELAGFRKLQDFEIEFLLKVCESFASVLRTAAMTERTSKLLENTQQQAEALQQKEEEMKRNMRDMEETMLELLNSSAKE